MTLLNTRPYMSNRTKLIVLYFTGAVSVYIGLSLIFLVLARAGKMSPGLAGAYLYGKAIVLEIAGIIMASCICFNCYGPVKSKINKLNPRCSSFWKRPSIVIACTVVFVFAYVFANLIIVTSVLSLDKLLSYL
jgi:hypothetical protein